MSWRGTWASRAQKHSEAGYGRPVDRGAWTAKTVKRPLQQPARPQYANFWAPLTRKRHIPPHSAQPRHTNYWAPRTRKRHQQEHRPQRPSESSNPTQHAKGRPGDCPGPRKGTTTRRNVTRGGGVHEGGPYAVVTPAVLMDWLLCAWTPLRLSSPESTPRCPMWHSVFARKAQKEMTVVLKSCSKRVLIVKAPAVVIGITRVLEQHFRRTHNRP